MAQSDMQALHNKVVRVSRTASCIASLPVHVEIYCKQRNGASNMTAASRHTQEAEEWTQTARALTAVLQVSSWMPPALHDRTITAEV